MQPRIRKRASNRNRSKFLLSTISCLLICSLSTTYVLAKNYTLGVSVEYNGKSLGVVQDANKVADAKKLVESQLVTSDADAEALLQEEAQYITVVKKEELMDEIDLAEALVDTEEQLIPAAAIYVDGDFYAAVDEPVEAESVLEDVLNERSVGTADEDLSFTEEVEVVEGIVPTEELSDSEAVKEEALENLTVASVRTESNITNIPFEEQVVESDAYPNGVEVVTQEGKDGRAILTEEITCINEEEVSRETVETVALSNGVPQITTVGTGEFSLSSDVIFLTLPLEGSYLSSPYGSRWGRTHNGVDLCLRGGTQGAEIVSCYAGTVTVADYSGGYGNMVELDHGNGYTTRYAHMESLSVSTGDVVTAGTLLGHAGSTGNSTGAHLHFEILQDGTSIDPLPYLPEVEDE